MGEHWTLLKFNQRLKTIAQELHPVITQSCSLIGQLTAPVLLGTALEFFYSVLWLDKGKSFLLFPAWGFIGWRRYLICVVSFEWTWSTAKLFLRSPCSGLELLIRQVSHLEFVRLSWWVLGLLVCFWKGFKRVVCCFACLKAHYIILRELN